VAENTLALADFAARVGTVVGVSPWLLIDQTMIDRFADVTRDHQYIHIDPIRAAATELGGTIAHGYLTLALSAHLAEQALPALAGAQMTINYGFERLRFLHPVPSGARIRAHFGLVELDQGHPGQVRFHWDLRIEIEGVDKPALIARWITLAVIAQASV